MNTHKILLLEKNVKPEICLATKISLDVTFFSLLLPTSINTKSKFLNKRK